MNFQYLFPKNAESKYLGMKMTGMESMKEANMEGMMMVMDNGKMISFIEQSNMKLVNVMVIPDVEEDSGEEDDFFGGEEEAKKEVPEFKKTGKTKTILGYTCHEYLTETEEYTMTSWVAPDLKQQTNGMSAMFLAMNKNAKMNDSAFNSTDMGLMLEMKSINKKDNETFIMTATEINLDKSTKFSTEGYQQLNINNMMGGDKKN
jgi:hypothetical protein